MNGLLIRKEFLQKTQKNIKHSMPFINNYVWMVVLWEEYISILFYIGI